MTPVEVERLAREAGGSIVRDAAARNWAGLMAFDTAELARFAALVQAAERERILSTQASGLAEMIRAQERERCAKVCDDMVLYTGFDCAAAIRAD